MMTPEIDALHCTICRKPIPEARAQRQTSTCSEKCKNRLDTIRNAQRAARKCSKCLHPSTPEERELFRVWRLERGDIARAIQGREYSTTSKNDLRKALREAVGALKTFSEGLPTSEASDAPTGTQNAGNGHSREELTELIGRLGELSKYPRVR